MEGKGKETPKTAPFIDMIVLENGCTQKSKPEGNRPDLREKGKTVGKTTPATGGGGTHGQRVLGDWVDNFTIGWSGRKIEEGEVSSASANAIVGGHILPSCVPKTEQILYTSLNVEL